MRIVTQPPVLVQGNDHCRFTTEMDDLVGIA